MTDTLKKYIAIAGILAALIVAFSVWKFASAYTRSTGVTSGSFSALGEGKVTAIPDVAEFSFSVITEDGKDIAALQNENVGKTNKAIAFLKDKGVDSKDIRTSQYSLNPRYETCSPSATRSCPPPAIVGYSIVQSVSVKVRDFTKIGDILAGVVGQGVNSVSELRFTVDDPIGLQNEARAKAIENAKERARVVARAGSFRIGRIISIEDGYTPVYPMYDRLQAGGAEVKNISPTPPTIEPGSQELTVQVVIRYEID